MGDEETIRRIARVSAAMGGVCTSAMVAIPFVLALFWALVPLETLRALPIAMFPVAALPPESRALAFAATMVPGGIAVYGLAKLRRLFAAYRRGHIFEPGNAAALRAFAVSVLAAAVAKLLLATPALSVILTMHNAPGERALAISIGSDDVASLFVGAVLMVIAWTLAEAHRLAEDNAQFV